MLWRLRDPLWGSASALTVCFASALSGTVDFLIYLGNFAHPNLTLLVFHREYVVDGPMEVVRDVSYLLIDAFQGVAYDSPMSVPKSNSKSWLHAGHFILIAAVPSSFIRR